MLWYLAQHHGLVTWRCDGLKQFERSSWFIFCGFLPLLLCVRRHHVAKKDTGPRTFCLIGVHGVWRCFSLRCPSRPLTLDHTARKVDIRALLTALTPHWVLLVAGCWGLEVVG